MKKTTPIKPEPAVNPNLILAVEFGFKGAEKGWNLDMTLAEFKKAMKA